MMKVPVNRIIDFSNVDGPGNRCAIFLQSCPFACLYCHNPETIHICVNCGKCVESCPATALHMIDDKVVFDPAKCVECDTCIHVCEHLASPRIRYLTSDEIVEHIKTLKPFIRGITISGGECMNHADFLMELFPKVKELGLTCLIDSNGAHDFSKYPQLLAACDGVMLDVKAVDPTFHEYLCGMGNEVVLKNLDYLLEQDKLCEVRTVLLPHHEKENLETVTYVSKRLQDRSFYKLIRYRPYGVRDVGLKELGNEIYPLENALKLAEICKSNHNVLRKII